MAPQPLKILLVEDNPGDARLVGAMLSSPEQGGFVLTHAKRMHEALELLSQDSFDAVLLDLSLPDSSGVETIDQAAGRDPDGRTPIIVITGRYTDHESLQSMQHGAQDFLLKNNLHAESLVRSIRFAVERQRQRLKAEAAEAEQRRDRAINALEEMGGGPATTSVTARAYGMHRLSEASPDTFAALVEQYGELIEQAIEERRFRIEGRVSQGLRVMAQRLGFLRASPRDVVELHISSIRNAQPVKMTTSYIVAEEARLMLLELMGNLATYYRDHMMPVGRSRPATASSEKPSDGSRE